MSKPLLFSEDDADLMQVRWQFDRYGYARRNINGPQKNWVWIFAHTVVCERAFGRRPDYLKKEVCDHINRNKMDNRRVNLRIVSISENNKNTSPWKPKCGEKHSTLHKCGKYQSLFRYKGKCYYVGLFSSPEAAKAATIEAKEKLILETEGRAQS